MLEDHRGDNMKAEDILKLIQYDRHDMMNDLQIISGYLSIGNTEKVSEKLHDMINRFHRDKKLLSTKASHFVLWLMMINHVEPNIRVNYDVNFDEVNLSSLDEKMTNHCQLLIDGIKAVGSNQELYHVKIHIVQEGLGTNEVKIVFYLTGEINDDALFSYIDRKEIDPPLHLEKHEKGINGTITYYLSQ